MAIAEVLRAAVSVTIRTTPERAFDAWLDPAIAARFLAGTDCDGSLFTNDPVEGGAFRVLMSGQAGKLHDHEGRYVVIDRPNRLIFTWVSVGTGERLSLVTVTFTAVAGGVRLDLLHEGLPSEAMIAAHAEGWTEILEKLQAELA